MRTLFRKIRNVEMLYFKNINRQDDLKSESINFKYKVYGIGKPVNE